MSDKENNVSQRNIDTILKWVIWILIFFVVFSLISFGIFGTMMLCMFLTVTLAVSILVGRLSSKEHNKIPLMMLGGMLGIIIGGSLVLYYVHERKELCTPPYESNAVAHKMSCLL